MSEVIRKSITLLMTIKPNEQKEEWSATEISRQLNLPVQTVHRLLTSLSEYGFVLQNKETKKFKLGLALMELGLSIINNLSVRNIALPVMERLATKTKESVYLTIAEGTDGIFIDCIDSPQLLKIVEPIGMRIPLCVGASKKVILANLNPKESQQVMRELRDLKKIDNFNQLETDLKRIREQGFAVSYGETTEGTVSVAAPIFSWEDEVIASISVAGPESRFKETRLRELVMLTYKAALEISEDLGWINQRKGAVSYLK
ncbi:IclR family transcriptional regulator [Alkalihalobacillus sp. BA299]|uniref:IclR family transcriptional regulator n=1 Tax=Alkalihalobacillus sp. BA299 TaxID=2815938 RepID=UPI001ADAEB94|nr:IclR family transcriptional regulator [Alkalihalobacillus sp. BA299]